MPGQMPRIPTPLAGAAATDADAVPDTSAAGLTANAVTLLPWNSGCDRSTAPSTNASSGLRAVTTGGSSAGSTTASRHAASGDSGSGGRLGAVGDAVGLGVDQQATPNQRTRQRAGARSAHDVRAPAKPHRAIAPRDGHRRAPRTCTHDPAILRGVHSGGRRVPGSTSGARPQTRPQRRAAGRALRQQPNPSRPTDASVLLSRPGRCR